MKKLVRLTALVGVLVLATGAPAYARGGGGGGGGHAGGGGGGRFAGGGGARGRGARVGGPTGGIGLSRGGGAPLGRASRLGWASRRVPGRRGCRRRPLGGAVRGPVWGVLALRPLGIRAVGPACGGPAGV